MRPVRARAPDFCGRRVSLPGEAASWHRLDKGGARTCALVLGLGPAIPDGLFDSYSSIYWLEEPKLRQQLKTQAPHSWTMATVEDLDALAEHCAIYFYAPGLRLRPAFWLPIISRLQAESFSFKTAPGKKSVWLPGHQNCLLHADLAHALTHLGYGQISCVQPAWDAFLEHMRPLNPQFALSVNFRGLDGDGRIFGLCRALGIPLGIWLVDNPWNLLSGVALPWWKEAHIFVTDASFLPSLKAVGAENAHYLPLAAPWHMRPGNKPAPKGKPLFVGRSSFPNKAGYFAGIKLDAVLEARAAAMVKANEWPDFHWWSAQTNDVFWPGKGARLPALGAENASSMRRAFWLGKASDCGFEIVGDPQWRKFLPNADVKPPVDYYGPLPRLYESADCVLNVTSLLIPQSLSQRHFDVWAAGGFLLSDATMGLGLFPSDLAEPITLQSPEELAPKLAWLRGNPGIKAELASEWRSLILSQHLYEHRLRQMLEIIAG